MTQERINALNKAIGLVERGYSVVDRVLNVTDIVHGKACSAVRSVEDFLGEVEHNLNVELCKEEDARAEAMQAHPAGKGRVDVDNDVAVDKNARPYSPEPGSVPKHFSRYEKIAFIAEFLSEQGVHDSWYRRCPEVFSDEMVDQDYDIAVRTAARLAEEQTRQSDS